MEELKIKNFLKTYHGVDFPAYESLGAVEAQQIRSVITNKLKLEDHGDSLLLVKKIDVSGEMLKGINAEAEEFSLKETLFNIGFGQTEYAYINWYRFDEIDKLKLNELDKYFSDIWYPSTDDVDIFDDSLTWILSITHDGRVKILKI